MIKDRELELNFPCISFFMFFMLYWQALAVAALIPIVWLDFSKSCLPHPSTTASLMFCRVTKFLPKGKTWGRTRQRPAMTYFHRKVNKFWQRFAKCDACLRQKFLRQQIKMFKLYFGLNKFVKLRKLIILLEKFVQFQGEILTALDLCLVSSAIITVTATS